MKEYSLNKKFIVAFIILTAAVALMGKVISMFLLGEILIYGEANKEISLLLAALLFVIGLSYLYSVIMMIRQYAVHGGKAFTFTKEGIQDTIVYVNVLAFIFVVPVKEIPWDAIQKVEKEHGAYIAKIDVKQVEAGVMAKLVLKMAGYQFCSMFVSDDIGKERRILEKMAVK